MMQSPWCARCKPTDMPSTVVASTSGFASAFHRSRRCELLIGGQAKVIRRGGDSTAVESVNLRAALGRVSSLAKAASSPLGRSSSLVNISLAFGTPRCCIPPFVPFWT